MKIRPKVYFSGNMWITPADSQVREIPSLTMDFDTLFQDLENQLERELDAELINRLDDEERERRAKLTLRERLLALQRTHNTSQITGTTRDGREFVFVIKNVGKDWAALEAQSPAYLTGPVICALHAIRTVQLPGDVVRESLGTPVGEVSDHDLRALAGNKRLAEKVNLAFVLRDISRRRKQVRIHTTEGVLAGTIDHVGVDHLDISTGGTRQILMLREVLYVQIL
jgi:hypothetical protein